ncbi:MAG: Recombination protein RecO [uncultured Campylobacterales bacterium]|uniref:Recombination protein RecO n=1 Tax=uncultured Campylobacterales bacterium TaxID=352960 RepID=A0A6S6RXI8_9BACT|nr:MAG: Recombination protein RecO [uncultured Campylobacterales bacterium]
MQGYILKTNRVKDEDLIVTIITKDEIKTVYRFYGTRHSKIQLGFKLDFEVTDTNMLINTNHILNGSWIFDRQTLYIWQQLCIMYSKHLFGLNEIEEFYYNLLENISTKLHKQNPKRVLIEGYLDLLEYEGRLDTKFLCANCNQEIEGTIAFGRAFLPFHTKCVYSNTKIFNKNIIKKTFEEKNSMFLNDNDIDRLYSVLEMGF